MNPTYCNIYIYRREVELKDILEVLLLHVVLKCERRTMRKSESGAFFCFASSKFVQFANSNELAYYIFSFDDKVPHANDE